MLCSRLTFSLNFLLFRPKPFVVSIYKPVTTNKPFQTVSYKRCIMICFPLEAVDIPVLHGDGHCSGWRGLLDHGPRKVPRHSRVSIGDMYGIIICILVSPCGTSWCTAVHLCVLQDSKLIWRWVYCNTISAKQITFLAPGKMQASFSKHQFYFNTEPNANNYITNILDCYKQN